MIAAILAFSIISTILLILLVVLVSASEDREGAVASLTKHWLSRIDIIFPMISVLTVVTASIAFVLFLNLYKPGRAGADNYFSNLAVELGGIAYELFVVGIAFALYEKRKNRLEDIRNKQERNAEEKEREIRQERKKIENYIPLKTDHGKIIIWQSIQRLNELGVKDITLTHADLSIIEASKESNVTKTIELEGVSFSDANFNGMNLLRSKFIRCVASGFSFTNQPNIQGNRSMLMLDVKFDGSSLQDGSFKGAYLRGASFKGVNFSREINFEKSDITNTDFHNASGADILWHQAEVGENFMTDITTWNIERTTFFRGHIVACWRHITVRPELRCDIRYISLILDRRKYESLDDLVYQEKPHRYALLDSENLVWINPLKEEK